MTRILCTLLESGEVDRFHAVPAIPAQSTSQHAWGVAIIVAHICGGHFTTTNLALAILLHDTGELITGDLPFTAKRGCFSHLKAALDAAEAQAMADHLWPMPELTDREENLLKLGDMLEGMRWADIHERVRPGGQPLIADRWWEALLEMFKGDAPYTLPVEERERAYQLLLALGPIARASAMQSTFVLFRATRDPEPKDLTEPTLPPVDLPPPVSHPIMHPGSSTHQKGVEKGFRWAANGQEG
jgi:5'-deoxynucleotidase YfbR-like HD superfamily hydrolase